MQLHVSYVDISIRIIRYIVSYLIISERLNSPRGRKQARGWFSWALGDFGRQFLYHAGLCAWQALDQSQPR